MALSISTMELRQQEERSLREKRVLLLERIIGIQKILFNGISQLTPTEWDLKTSEYHAALKSVQDCDDRLNNFKKWDEMTAQDRSKRKKNLERVNYKY